MYAFIQWEKRTQARFADVLTGTTMTQAMWRGSNQLWLVAIMEKQLHSGLQEDGLCACLWAGFPCGQASVKMSRMRGWRHSETGFKHCLHNVCIEYNVAGHTQS